MQNYLAAMREQGLKCLAAYNEEFNETKIWLEDALAAVKCSSQTPSILFPKTPSASRIKSVNRISGRNLFYRSNSTEVSSSTDGFNSPKKVKIEPVSIDESGYEESTSFETPANNTTVPSWRENVIPTGSIGLNSTYVNVGEVHKESIGANSTYVKAGPTHKESIGANSTYVKAGPTHKESIGANSTYVKSGPTHKESIGANSTYVKAGPTHTESIGANGTYVLEPSGNSTNISSNFSDSSSGSDQSILEASRIAVEEAMKGPARITRTKAKAVAQKAAQQAQTDVSVKTNTFKTTDPKAALRQARKSISRAKAVATKKQPDCNSGKLCCNEAHCKLGAVCKKPVLAGRLRCISQSETASPHRLINKNLAVSKIQRTLTHTDLKGPNSNNKKIPLAKAAPKNQGDRLQELAAKTLAACQRKQEIAKKKSDERAKKLQDRADQMASLKVQREKAALKPKETKAKEPKKNMLGETVHPKQVIQDDLCKENYLKSIATHGHSYLAKPLHLRDQDQSSTSNKTCAPVLKPAALPINQTFDIGSYDISLDPGERSPLPSKDENNYGLDDVKSDDSSDDEENPKKVIPKWAEARVRAIELHMQYEITDTQMFTFFCSKKSTPDLQRLFNDIDKRLLYRRSSAVWHSPEKKKGTN